MLKYLKQSRWYKELPDRIRNSQLQKAVLDGFAELGFEIPSRNNKITKSEFDGLFEQAILEIDRTTASLEQDLDECLKDIFADLRREISFERLASEPRLIWLCPSDRERLIKLVDTIKLLRSYVSDSDFDSKANTLSTMRTRLEELSAEITKYPTHLAYEVFLQRILRLLDVVSSERNSIFGEYPPDLTMNPILVAVLKDANGLVRVHFQIKNAKGCQMADNIKIAVVGSAIELIDTPESRVRGVRGGEAKEVLLSLKLPTDMWKSNVFDVEFEVLYEYNDEQSETISDFLQPPPFAINVSGDTPPISNPYKGKTKNVMESKEMFYGRDVLIEKLVSQIRGADGEYNRGHAVALFGQTRAGKSSILFHCKSQIVEKYGNEAIVVDYGSVGETAGERGFFYTLISELVGELETNHRELDAALESTDLKEYPDRILLHPEDGQLLFTDFFRKLRRLFNDLDTQKVIVLLIDEFTYFHAWIKNGELTPRFMQYWKAIMQDYGFYAIVVGQDNMPVFKKEYPNEFGAMELEPVTYLSQEYAYKLMDEPLLLNGKSRYHEKALERLYELTAGSAFLILMICDRLVEHLNRIGSPSITKAIIGEFLRENAWCQNSFVDRTTFESQLDDRAWPELGAKNEVLLLEIARATRDENGYAEISQLRCRDFSSEEITSLLDRLSERNVIIKVENKYCKIVVGLLKEWLLFHYGRED